MRAAASLVLIAAIAIGCGGSPTRPREPRPAPRARSASLEAGTRLDLEQRVEERRDGALVRIHRTRIELEIGERAPDGTYAARALLTVMQGDAPAGRMLLDLRLAPDLTLHRDPIVRCDELEEQDLLVERIARHLLGATPRPGSAVATGSTFRGELWDARREEPLDAESRLALRSPNRVRITSEAPLALTDDRLAGGLVTGRARVRVIADLDGSMRTGTIRTRTDSHATMRELDDGTAGPLPAQIRIDERIDITRATGALPTDGMCDLGPSLDPRIVVRAIQSRQHDIRACYERELRQDPTLAGSVRIHLTVEESGSVTGVHWTENTIATPRVADCIVRVIRTFRIRPGPTGGAVTFQFPFVFEPQR